MNNRKLKYFFIPLELICGISIGLLLVYFYAKTGIEGHLNDYYLKFFSTIYIGIILGVLISGFIYTILIKKPKNALKGLVHSFLGSITFLVIYIILTSFGIEYINYKLTAWILPVLLPLAGTVIGFNFSINR